MKIAGHNVKTLNDTHTNNQLNRLNIRVWLGLYKSRIIFRGFDANSAQIFQRIADYSSLPCVHLLVCVWVCLCVIVSVPLWVKFMNMFIWYAYRCVYFCTELPDRLSMECGVPHAGCKQYWNNNECMKKNNTKRLNMKTNTNIFIHKFTHTHTYKTLTQTLTRTRNTHATQTRQWRTISYALENPTPEKWPYLFIIPEPTLIFNRFTWFLLCESFNILTLYSVSFKRFE